MPRTVDHIVEVHQIAAERRAAGLPVWAGRINLANVFHNEEMTFEERRDAVVRIIRASRWFKSYDEYSDLHQLVEELSETTNGDDFDQPWDCIYDIANYDRIWIGTR